MFCEIFTLKHHVFKIKNRAKNKTLFLAKLGVFFLKKF